MERTAPFKQLARSINKKLLAGQALSAFNQGIRASHDPFLRWAEPLPTSHKARQTAVHWFITSSVELAVGSFSVCIGSLAEACCKLMQTFLQQMDTAHGHMQAVRAAIQGRC